MEQGSQITDEFVRKKVATGKRYVLRIFKVGPDRNQPPAEAERIQKEHLRYIFQLHAEGKLLINGPIVDDPVLKGISIFNTADMEQVKRLSESDPAVAAGRLAYEIYSYFGIPGQSIPE